MAVFPKTKHTTLVYLADRKPSQIVKNDYALIEFLATIEDSLSIAVNGNAGINIADMLRPRRSFGYVELPPDFQKSMELRIFGKTKLPQIIDVNYEN